MPKGIKVKIPTPEEIELEEPKKLNTLESIDFGLIRQKEDPDLEDNVIFPDGYNENFPKVDNFNEKLIPLSMLRVMKNFYNQKIARCLYMYLEFFYEKTSKVSSHFLETISFDFMCNIERDEDQTKDKYKCNIYDFNQQLGEALYNLKIKTPKSYSKINTFFNTLIDEYILYANSVRKKSELKKIIQKPIIIPSLLPKINISKNINLKPVSASLPKINNKNRQYDRPIYVNNKEKHSITKNVTFKDALKTNDKDTITTNNENKNDNKISCSDEKEVDYEHVSVYKNKYLIDIQNDIMDKIKKSFINQFDSDNSTESANKNDINVNKIFSNQNTLDNKSIEYLQTPKEGQESIKINQQNDDENLEEVKQVKSQSYKKCSIASIILAIISIIISLSAIIFEVISKTDNNLRQNPTNLMNKKTNWNIDTDLNGSIEEIELMNESEGTLPQELIYPATFRQITNKTLTVQYIFDLTNNKEYYRYKRTNKWSKWQRKF